MKTFRLFALFSASCVALALPVESSSEEPVLSLLSEATISTMEGNYRFKIKLDEKRGLAKIGAIYKGKTIAVPDSELPDVKLCDLRQSNISTWRKVTSYKDPGTSVILVIPFEQEFRKDPEGEPNDDEVRVSNVLRMLFHEGEFVRWEIAASLGEKSNAWALSYKEKGEAVTDDGKETELTNPYWHYNPVNYSTEWSKED